LYAWKKSSTKSSYFSEFLRLEPLLGKEKDAKLNPKRLEPFLGKEKDSI
jgi:hypothetical protein